MTIICEFCPQPIELTAEQAATPVFRFKCPRCGVENIHYGYKKK